MTTDKILEIRYNKEEKIILRNQIFKVNLIKDVKTC